MEKIIIGRKDKVDLPDFGLENIHVKVDSGAYSCSIDCHYYQEIEQEGRKVLEVIFLEDNHVLYTGGCFYFPEFRMKRVKSSIGLVQDRYFIKGKIIIFGKEYETEFSLSKRHEMKNPILIGRKLLNNQFLVDSSQVNLSYKLKKKVKK
ncbi:MAG: ATP-dependent zinc protease [Flavobacteriia bacterium]|nr:ATP-dependent zinc protease [Flavobacteriia bacterium]